MPAHHTLLGSLDADYMFHSETRRIEFAVVEDGMAELNNYCVTVLEALRHEHERRVATSRSYLEADDGVLIGNFETAFEEDGDDEGETRGIHRWQWFQPVVTRAMCLVMLGAFAERALWSLAWFVVDDPDEAPGEAKVDRYLGILRDEHDRPFEEPANFSRLRERCRSLRTAFAEGDWMAITDSMEGVELSASFRAASEFFEILEQAYLLEER